MNEDESPRENVSGLFILYFPLPSHLRRYIKFIFTYDQI